MGKYLSSIHPIQFIEMLMLDEVFDVIDSFVFDEVCHWKRKTSSILDD